MNLDIKDITAIINDGKKLGHEVKVGDIAFSLLCNSISDTKIAFAVLFGKDFSDKDIEKYQKSKKISYVNSYIKANFMSEGGAISSKKEELTFEENKAAMISMIDELKEKYNDGMLEYKDYAKMVADLRIKLNDKFNITGKEDESRVVVYKKYNDICVCGREIYKPTKEDIIEELEKEYDLVPKQKEEL